MRLIGEQALRFELVNGWEVLPEGWTHFDVPAICTDSEDNVFLYCRGERRIIILDPSGKAIDTWGDADFGKRAHAALISSAGDLYLVDEGQHSVNKYTTAGQHLLQIGPSGSPSATGYVDENYRTTRVPAGPFNRPTGIGLLGEEQIYVSDGYGNCQVHLFDDGGTLVRSWGAPGRNPGEFYVPHALAVDSRNRILVADRENERIQIFSPGGDLVDIWTDVQRPQGIFVDAEGQVFVAEGAWSVGWESQRTGKTFTERVPGRISVHDPDGNVLARWEQPDEHEDGFLLSPHGIWVDSQGSIYVGTNVGTFGRVMGQTHADCVLKFARL